MKTSNYLFLIACIFLFSCQSKEMKKAKEYIDASMFKEAESLLEIETQDNPKNSEAHFLLGKCHLYVNDQTKADECFKRAILLDDNYKGKVADIFLDKAFALITSGKEDFADNLYAQAIIYNPLVKNEFAKKLYDYTIKQMELETKSEPIIRLFAEVRKISSSFDQNISEAMFKRAKIFFEKGFEENGFNFAETSLNFSHLYDKDITQLYFNCANLYLRDQNKYSWSIKLLDRCIELNSDFKPKIGDLYYNTANYFISIKVIDIAMVYAKKSCELKQSYNTWYMQLSEKYKPKIPIDGLVAFYPFNGNTNDESGNGNNGTNYGAKLATDRFGNAGKAYSFFETNSYIIAPSRGIPLGNSPRTISAWVNPNKTNQDYYIVGWGQLQPDQTSYLNIYQSRFRYVTSTGSQGGEISGPSIIDGGVWYHIVITYNGSVARLYINGNEVGYKAYTLHTSITNIAIGTAAFSPSYGNFVGLIDDIRIYNRVLSIEEINKLYKDDR